MARSSNTSARLTVPRPSRPREPWRGPSGGPGRSPRRRLTDVCVAPATSCTRRVDSSRARLAAALERLQAVDAADAKERVVQHGMSIASVGYGQTFAYRSFVGAVRNCPWHRLTRGDRKARCVQLTGGMSTMSDCSRRRFLSRGRGRRPRPGATAPRRLAGHDADPWARGRCDRPRDRRPDLPGARLRHHQYGAVGDGTASCTRRDPQGDRRLPRRRRRPGRRARRAVPDRRHPPREQRQPARRPTRRRWRSAPTHRGVSARVHAVGRRRADELLAVHLRLRGRTTSRSPGAARSTARPTPTHWWNWRLPEPGTTGPRPRRSKPADRDEAKAVPVATRVFGAGRLPAARTSSSRIAAATS